MNLLEFLTPKSETYYIDKDSTVRQAMEKFEFHRFTCVCIIDDDGTYCGTVSEGDILRFITYKSNFDIKIAENTKITDIEKYRPYKAIKIDLNFDDALKLSLEQNFIPLVDDQNHYIGIIKRKSIIDFLYKNSKIDLD